MYLGMCVEHYKNGDMTYAQKIEKLAEMGFKYQNGCNKRDASDKQAVVEIKAALRDTGCIPVQSGGGVPQWGGFDPADGDKVLEAAKPFLDNAAEIGNLMTCVLPPVWNEDMPREVSWGTSIEWTRKYAAMAKERGMVVTCEIEPEVRFITTKFGDAVRWLEHLDCDNFFMNVDTGHFTLWKYKAEWLRKYTEMVVHTHITDNDGRHQSWVLGTGITDNVGYYNALLEGGFVENAKKHGIPPVACLELYMPDHTGPNYDEEVRLSIDWVKENLPMITFE